ncbi:MAG: phage capsid protein, partial [Burkholderiales bacterium]|nr:phage capsid protein [Burkholderiales bacterium]
MGAPAPFPIQPDLTAIAIMYRNKDMIADNVLPRVPVGKQDFKYLKHTLADGFTIPDTKVGRRSPPTQVEFSAVEVPASCVDYALDDSVPNEDIENAPPNYAPLGKAAEFVSNLIELDREKRAATLVFANGTYAASNRSTLSGTSQWSDFVNSNPISAILTALDACVMRPNIMIIGQAVWT